ncbi:hypothetical protein Y032_0106g3760 [Ancylostoma ceylanicum]|uniref:Uncharacterized protein n=1 Tax=Ancylostoma ceylanicum TaxID=53326 RepID=A0A016TFW9_9BILA|nr:hypothetical protein Y032_0106g3760 [Ancylostoma ceylanicum]
MFGPLIRFAMFSTSLQLRMKMKRFEVLAKATTVTNLAECSITLKVCSNPANQQMGAFRGNHMVTLIMS